MSLFELFEWCMVLFPILNIYLTPIPGISIGELIILVIGIMFLLQKGKNKFNRPVLVFYAYTLLITVLFTVPTFAHISQEQQSDGITKIVSYVLYAVFLLIYFNVGHIKSFCNKYLKAARIICVLTLIQYVLSIIGLRIPLTIPGIQNVAGRSFQQLLSFQSMSGPFTEPAHFAQYISVALILSLLNKKINIKHVILFSVSMALTLKGTAVTQLIVIFGVFFFRYFYSHNSKKAIRGLLLIIAGTFGVVLLYSTVEAVRIMFSRVYEIVGAGNRSLTGYYGVSGYFRVKYGFDFFNSL